MSADRAVTYAQYRELPPVGDLLALLEPEARVADVPGDLLLAWTREALEEARTAVRSAVETGAELPAEGRAAWSAWCESRVRSALIDRTRTQPRRVINATGVLLHTNLGRAPYPAAAARMLLESANGYSNLEMDLESGRRRSRLEPVRRLLPLVTGAEAGIAVHNNAAAVYLALVALSAGREVVVSRGHLVEIGGSFRLPEIMAASGARLVEVGSTNRTRIADYERAITAETALLLKVHPSNFRLIGFTEDVPTPALAALARERGIPFLYDTGSGALRAHGALAFDEPRVEDAIDDGADLVCFSGDKLLGGPQAGILVGRRVWIDRLSKHPVARVVRLDKTALATLAAVLELWCDPPVARTRLPLLTMLARTEQELELSALRLRDLLRVALGDGWTLEVLATEAEVGGGSLPGLTLPSRAVALGHGGVKPDDAARALRLTDIPVAGRIQDDRLLLETRALLPGDEERIGLAAAVLRRMAADSGEAR